MDEQKLLQDIKSIFEKRFTSLESSFNKRFTH